MPHKRTVDVQDGDDEFIRQFNEDIHGLCKMVEEMMVTTPVTLLSPLFRQMLAMRAEKLDKKRSLLANHLTSDNMGDPFNQKYKE